MLKMELFTQYMSFNETVSEAFSGLGGILIKMRDQGGDRDQTNSVFGAFT